MFEMLVSTYPPSGLLIPTVVLQTLDRSWDNRMAKEAEEKARVELDNM